MSHLKSKNQKIKELIKKAQSRGSKLVEVKDASSTNNTIIGDVVHNIFPQIGKINEDVYDFSKILFMELGPRYKYLDLIGDVSPAAQNLNRDPDTVNIAITMTNIENSRKRLKNMIYLVAKKIAGRGINPYLTTDIETNKDLCDETKVLDYPDDMNTFLNCLDNLINQKDNPVKDTKDIYLQYYITLFDELKVEFFNDSYFNTDPILETDHKFDMFQFILLLIKMDTLLFSILYRLGINDAFVSPLTGVYYNKKILAEPTPSDTFVAGQMLDQLLDIIFRFITQNNPIDVIENMERYFNEEAPQDNQYDEDMIVGKTEIPPMMYGQLLSMCDIAFQAYRDKSLPPTNTTVNILNIYDKDIFREYIIDSLYSLKAISEIIESFICSKAFITILSALYPSDSTPNPNGKNINLDVVADNVDIMNMLLSAIFGPDKFNLSFFIPANSLPHVNNTIEMSMSQLYAVHNKLATISRLLFGKNAPILKESDFYNTSTLFHGPAPEHDQNSIPMNINWDYIKNLMEYQTYVRTENNYVIVPIINYIQSYIDMIEKIIIQNTKSLQSLSNIANRVASRKLYYQPKPLVQNKPKTLIRFPQATEQSLDERIQRILRNKDL